MDAELRKEHAEMRRKEMLYRQSSGEQEQGEGRGQLPGYEDLVNSGQFPTMEMREMSGNGEAR